MQENNNENNEEIRNVKEELNSEEKTKEEQNDIIMKQKLIKENILDKHYDKDQFFSYCMRLKPENGDNLKNWTIEELNQTINNFISDKNQYYLNTQKEMSQNIQINNNPNISKNSNIYEVPCGKLEKTILNDKQIKVEIKNPRSIEGGLFTNSYILYDIETTIDNINTIWLVQRRYSDFIWLRESLSKFFPREFIPPIPGKKIGGRRFEIDFVVKYIFGENIRQRNLKSMRSFNYIFISN